MMYVDNPVFKEILWEWRAFAIKVDPNICRNILNLPLKDGKSTKMLDIPDVTKRCVCLFIEEMRCLHNDGYEVIDHFI